MSRPEMKKQPEPEIRLAVPGDEAAIAEVLFEAFSTVRENYTDEAFEVVTPSAEAVRARFDEGPMWVASIDCRIVGTVSVIFEPEGVYIRSMAVRPDVQGRGVAHRLMEAIDEFWKTTGRDRIFLYTTYFTKGARQLYEKHGFRWVRDTTADEWYGTPGLEMEKLIESEVSIDPARAGDTEDLSALMKRVYVQHFTHLWHDEGAAYVERSFSREALTAQLEDEENRFFFVRVDGKPVGFLKLRPGSTSVVFEDADAFEIERIYLDSAVIGSGVGRKVMEFAVEHARELNKDIVWLKVMDSNERTIRFYERCGFEKVGTERLDLPFMKDELRGMFVMKRDLRK
jgi:diamine N-acetyltransferase